MDERQIGERLLLDGVTRPVFEDKHGQYVVGDNGEIMYGVWLVPGEPEAGVPVVVTGPEAE